MEAGLDPHGNGDPYAPYHAPFGENASPWNEGYADNFNSSNVALAALPLVSNATPFQQPDLYEDEFENKSIQSEEYNAQSRFTSAHDKTNSHFYSESYAPS